MKNHDKLFVTGMNFTQKVNGLIKKILFKSRDSALNKIESNLKNNSSFFENKSFSWFCGSEFYGDYSEIKIIIKKVDKKYNCLEFDIYIPKQTIVNFKNISENEINVFYENLYDEVINIDHVIPKEKKLYLIENP